MGNEKLLAHLEVTELAITKAQLARGECGPVGGENERFVSAWVAEQDAAITAAAAARAEVREEKTLEISRRALTTSIWAIVVSVFAIVVSVLVAFKGSRP